MTQQDLLSYGLPALLLAAFLIFKRLGRVGSAEARRLVKEGALLLDVRSEGEFAQAHLPGALNVPVNQLGARVKALGAKERPIVVYCASGTRSAMARSVLKGLGYTRVVNLGPMSAWS